MTDRGSMTPGKKTALRRLVDYGLYRLGYRLVGLRQREMPVELSPRDREIYDYVVGRKLTMVTHEGLLNAMLACRYVEENGISGDVVECGVWRGGTAIAAALVLEALGSKRKIWLYDTFAGMAAPKEADVRVDTGQAAASKHASMQRQDHNEWAYCSLEDVKANVRAAGISDEQVRFVEGDVLETLSDAANLPAKISVLRLDTDWYESTKKELEVLYPRVAEGGVLIVDDYGRWKGAQQATDEYFASEPGARPFFQIVNVHASRCGVKIAG